MYSRQQNEAILEQYGPVDTAYTRGEALTLLAKSGDVDTARQCARVRSREIAGQMIQRDKGACTESDELTQLAEKVLEAVKGGEGDKRELGAVLCLQSEMVRVDATASSSASSAMGGCRR